MRNMLGLMALGFGMLLLAMIREQGMDPYEEGMHLDYSIQCENGFVYKVQGTMLSSRAIQVLNSDGTPLRCGQKIH